MASTHAVLNAVRASIGSKTKAIPSSSAVGLSGEKEGGTCIAVPMPWPRK